MKIFLTLLFLLTLPTFSFASTLSYMIKNDGDVESYLKIKNANDSVYLKFYCNNFINDITISLEGLKEEEFFSKNSYESKIMFNKKNKIANWIVKYDENSKFSLVLDDEGMQFSSNLYQEGNILIDIPEMKGLKFFSVEHGYYLRNKMDLVFENCSVYL